MNSPKIKEAINKVYEELISMDKKKFKAMIEKHKNGEYAIMLRQMWNDGMERAQKGTTFGFLKPVSLPDKYKIWKYELDPNNKTQMFFFGLGIGVIIMVAFMIWSKI